jgi:hypothetical protein
LLVQRNASNPKAALDQAKGYHATKANPLLTYEKIGSNVSRSYLLLTGYDGTAM